MGIQSEDHGSTGRVRCSVSIGAAPDALSQAWRRPSVQQQVMGELATLVSGDAGAMRWRIDLPMDQAIELESEEVEYIDGERVRHASRTTGGPAVRTRTELALWPAPADFGTEATMTVDYELPGGAVAGTMLKMLGSAPDVMADKVLRRFKALIEAGEIPTLERNPSARGDHR